MDQKYQMLTLEKPDNAAWEMIGGGITAFNLAHAGSDAANAHNCQHRRCKLCAGK